MPLRTDRTYAEIDVSALRNNVNFFRKKCAGKKIIAVFKASCYGHGDELTRFVCNKIDCIGVATVEEGCRIREFCKNTPILVLGFVPPESVKEVLKNKLTLSIFSDRYAAAINAEAVRCGKAVNAHVKINTGMDRLGFAPSDKEKLLALPQYGNLHISGIFSHYAFTERESPVFFATQTKLFLSAVDFCLAAGMSFDFVHMANTAAASSEAVGNAVRIGYGLYGYGCREVTPVLTWKARVVQLHEAAPGERIGYSGSYLVRENSLIATISAGYGDGYPRIMSNCGKVLFNGLILPVVGRICMDMFMIDATGSGITEGDEVILVGKSGNAVITAENLGFGYEVLCGISPRVKRYYINQSSSPIPLNSR